MGWSRTPVYRKVSEVQILSPPPRNMKIFICCSKHFYHKIPPIKQALENQEHIITLPNSYDDPMREEQLKSEAEKSKYVYWKTNMIRTQETKIRDNDAILVLNFEKNGQLNYI